MEMMLMGKPYLKGFCSFLHLLKGLAKDKEPAFERSNKSKSTIKRFYNDRAE